LIFLCQEEFTVRKGFIMGEKVWLVEVRLMSVVAKVSAILQSSSTEEMKMIMGWFVAVSRSGRG